MKFITEDDLRRMYREAPFDEYPYQEGSRLTPGGRQFLLDRGVKIGERQMDSGKPVYQTQDKSGHQTQRKPEHQTQAKPMHLSQADQEFGGDNDHDIRAKLALQTIAADFLQAGVDLLETDILLAQEVFVLEQYLITLLRGEEQPGKLDDQPCTGLEPDNFSENMGICFEINGFHAQSEKGREIVKLHYLRCLLQEQEPWLPGFCRNGVNCMINRLSQMICRALGGTVCQRKQ